MSETTSTYHPETSMEIGEFHNRDGWYFTRLPDGAVRIRKTKEALVDSPTEYEHTIPENEWASIVAHVSAHGEDGATWSAARAFHASTGSTSSVATAENALREVFAFTEPLALLLAMGRPIKPLEELLPEVQRINRTIAAALAKPADAV